MMKLSHVALGGLTAFAAAQGEPLLTMAVTVGAALFASEVPDWDLRFGIPHRGITHWVIWPALIWFFVPYAPLAHGLAIGWGAHILADCWTVDGLRPFWPLPFHLRGFVRTGSISEPLVVLPALALLVKYGILS